MHHHKGKLRVRYRRYNVVSSDYGFLPKVPEVGQSLSHHLSWLVMIFKKEKKNHFTNSHENLYLQVTPFQIVTVTRIKEIYLLRIRVITGIFPRVFVLGFFNYMWSRSIKKDSLNILKLIEEKKFNPYFKLPGIIFYEVNWFGS